MLLKGNSRNNETFSISFSHEMDAVKLMNRVDTKFTISEKQFLEVFVDLKDEYNILEVNNDKFSEYESLYFDQEDFKFYNDHHRGKSNRLKIRIRKYKSNGLAFLEVKKAQRTNHKIKDKNQNLGVKNLQKMNGNSYQYVLIIMTNLFQV